MIKAPLAALFPKLFPHGSLDGSGRYSRRPRSHLVQRLPLPASFDDRGRLVHTPSPALTGLSTNTTFGLRRGDVPLGQIGKTTHVDVQYDYNIDYPEDCSVGCQRSTSIPNLNGR